MQELLTHVCRQMDVHKKKCSGSVCGRHVSKELCTKRPPRQKQKYVSEGSIYVSKSKQITTPCNKVIQYTCLLMMLSEDQPIAKARRQLMGRRLNCVSGEFPCCLVLAKQRLLSGVRGTGGSAMV